MPETNRPEADQSGKSPETLAEEDRDEVLRLSLDEAKKTYFEFWLSDNNETAKSKAIQKIHELLTGEYDDLVLPATEKFLAELEKETTPEETVHLEKIIAEPGKKSAANSEPVEPMPAPAELPVEEEPIEIQPLAADKINPPVVPVVSKVEPPTTDKIPPRLTRPRAEGPTRKSEISDQEKDVIVQTTLDVFQETLKTSSVGAAENAARIKFRESAWELGEATYKELLQKVTQKINELETAERERIKPPMDATVERPAAPAVESPPPAADISKPKNEELEAKDKENIITKSIEVYDEAITEGKDVAEAEAASLRKFTELVQGMERTEAVEIITELKSVWRKKKKEEGKTSVSAPTVERRAGPPVGTEKLDENQNDLAALREQAQKLGMAFSDQVSAEEIRNRIDKKIRFENPSVVNEAEPPVEETPTETPEGPVVKPPEAGLLSTDQEKKPLEAAELTAEELDAIFAVAKAENIGGIEKLPEATKEKLGLGFNNLGFFVEENKNRLFAEAFEKAGEKLNLDKKGTWGRFVSSLAENYRRDQAKAQEKYEAIKQGGKEHLSNLSYLGGNILRYGRTVLDFTGYTIASPFRYVTMGAMMFSRGAEAAKEARFKNEEVIEKTRVANVEIAEKEAWRIYEEAQKKAGDGEVTKAELNQAFLENLPRDVLKRLMLSENDPTEKTNIATRVIENVTRRWIDSSLWRIQKKIDQAETEAEKQKILKKYETKLNDFNRLVGDWGEIDALAMGARMAQMAGKGTANALAIETLVALPLEKIFDIKIWDSLAGALSEKSPMENLEGLRTQAAEITEGRNEVAKRLVSLHLGISFEDGLTDNEAQKIAGLAEELKSAGKKPQLDALTRIFGNMETSDTGKSVTEIISARQEKLEDLIRATGSPIESTPAPEQKFQEFVLGEKIKIEPSHFENTIEPGGDSIWKSTREIFIKNARELGYTEDKGDVTQWAETQTANTVKELAGQEYGGKITDLVHPGDKVTVEVGGDGRPHLKFENLSGQEPGYLPQAESDASSSETTVSTPSTEVGTPAQNAELEKLAREYQALPLESKDEFVYNYIAKELDKPEYRRLKLPHLNEEKLLAFARMFGGGDLTGINSPEKLARTLVEFDENLKFYTQRLVDGSLDGIFKEGGQKAYDLTANVFPVEARDGNIFYAQIQKNGVWRIADSNGDPLELKRPIMGKTNSFDLKNVKKLLGY